MNVPQVQTDDVSTVIERMRRQDINKHMKAISTEFEEETLQDKDGRKMVRDKARKMMQQEEDIKVAGFLRAVSSIMERELERGAKSLAFEGWSVSWTEEQDRCKCILELTLPQHVSRGLEFEDHPPSCTYLSWNCNGTRLAASYGRLQTTGWCTESGYICVWNTSMATTVSPDEISTQPQQQQVTIEVEECYVTCIQFHPTNADVIACGTYDGGIKIWRIQGDADMLFAQSRIDRHSHRDPVVEIVWLKNKFDGVTILASMGGDGKIMLWSRRLDPLMGFSFSYSTRHVPMGMTCICFARALSGNFAAIATRQRQSMAESDEFFVVGSEGGEVHRACLSAKTISTKPAQGLSSASTVSVKAIRTDFEYDGSVGYVSAVDCSPFNRNIFLTASSDGLVRVYNTFQSHDILSLQPSEGGSVQDAVWSPFRPCVIACTCSNGHLYVYDLMAEDNIQPALSMDIGQGKPVMRLRFNPQMRNYIASADYGGNVKLFSLSDHLTSSANLTRELSFLRKLCST